MNKYIRAVFINFVFFLISSIYFFVITPVAILVMGKNLYGLWVILNVIFLLSQMGMLGIGSVVSKYTSEQGEDAMSPNTILSASITILIPFGILVTLFIFLIRDWISAQFGLNQEMHSTFSSALIFIAISVTPNYLSRMFHAYLLSQIKNSLSKTIEFATHFLIWTGAVIIAYKTNNLTWMTFWGLLVHIGVLLALYIIVAPMVRFKWHFESGCLKRILNFSKFTFLETLAVPIFQQMDRIIVGFTLGPSAAGVYSVATSVALRLVMVVGQVTEVMLPYASRKITPKDNSVLFQVFRRMSYITSLIVSLLSALLILWMDTLLCYWISEDYSQNYVNIFRIIILSYLFVSICRNGHQTLIGMGKVNFTGPIFLFISLLSLFSIYILSIEYGLVGAAASNLVSFFLLSFNIIVYYSIGDNGLVKSMITDFGFSLIIPWIFYLLAHLWLDGSIFIRLVLSFGISIWFVHLILKSIKDSGNEFLPLKVFRS